MAALKYWDLTTGTWQLLMGGTPVFRQTYYPTSDFRTTQTPISATSFGVATGPSILVNLGPSGSAMVHFYAQVGMQNVSGLVAAVGVKAYPSGTVVVAPDENDCAFLQAPPVAGYDGPGFIASTFLVQTYQPQGQYTFAMNYKVGSGTAQMMRRRMAVVPLDLVKQ